jgi:predicted ATPase
MGMIMRGWAVAMQGHVQGATQAREGLQAYLAIGLNGYSYYFSLLTELHVHLGQHEEGLKALNEALSFVDKTGERVYEAELHRLKGELLLPLSPDNHPEAESCFQKAIFVAHQQQAKSLELRATTSLAKLLQQQGMRAEAYELLAPIYGWFTEGFDTADLQEAKALLEDLAQSRLSSSGASRHVTAPRVQYQAGNRGISAGLRTAYRQSSALGGLAVHRHDHPRTSCAPRLPR